MVSVSKTVQETLENPATNLAEEEQELVLPYVFEKYRLLYKEEGLKEGREEGVRQGIKEGIKEGRNQGMQEGQILVIKNFIKNNPDFSDEYLATIFEVSLDLVKIARKN